MLILADVLEALVGIRPERATQVITDAAVDIRQVTPGCMFVQLEVEPALVEGENTASAVIRQAFEAGAILALTQAELSLELRVIDVNRSMRPEALSNQDIPLCLRVENSLEALQKIASFSRKKLRVRTIAITGSVGKTSTKDLIADVLEQRFRTLKNSGKPDSEIEVPLAFVRLTTGHERAVIEVRLGALGSGSNLDDFLQPQVAVVTNISTRDAAAFETPEALQADKTNWLRHLPADGVVILNYDDLWVRGMAEIIRQNTRANILFYGLDPDADLWADEVEGLGLEGVHFRLHYHRDTAYMRIPLIGRHSVHTALRAAAVGLVEGLNLQEIVQGVRLGNTQLRMVVSQVPSGAIVIDDTYDALMESTIAALNLLDEMEGKKIAVLGGMPGLGRVERQGHEMVGIRAAKVVDHLVCVGDFGKQIASAARASWMSSSDIVQIATSEEAARYLRENLQENDVVLIKGPQSLDMHRISDWLEARL